MSYKTYTTEALVCGSTYHNTSDRNYLLFTKEAGMVMANARSVREERSKQRFALQDFSHIRVSLVKGKGGWRIGSVEAYGNPFMEAQTRSERAVVSFAILQLRRYVHGEVCLPQIYEDVFELLNLRGMEENSRILYQNLFAVRLLSELGYIAPSGEWKVVIEAETLKEAYACYTVDMAGPIARAVEEGAQASQL